MKVKVTTRGIPAVIAMSQRTPPRLFDAMWDATEEGMGVTADLIRALTPVMTINRGGSDRYPGELRDSIQTEITKRATGSVYGRVWTDTEWAPFVEKGTREHGEAHHMFALGLRAARPLVAMIFDAHVAKAING